VQLDILRLEPSHAASFLLGTSSRAFGELPPGEVLPEQLYSAACLTHSSQLPAAISEALIGRPASPLLPKSWDAIPRDDVSAALTHASFSRLRWLRSAASSRHPVYPTEAAEFAAVCSYCVPAVTSAHARELFNSLLAAHAGADRVTDALQARNRALVHLAADAAADLAEALNLDADLNASLEVSSSLARRCGALHAKLTELREVRERQAAANSEMAAAALEKANARACAVQRRTAAQRQADKARLASWDSEREAARTAAEQAARQAALDKSHLRAAELKSAQAAVSRRRQVDAARDRQRQAAAVLREEEELARQARLDALAATVAPTAERDVGRLLRPTVASSRTAGDGDLTTQPRVTVGIDDKKCFADPRFPVMVALREAGVSSAYARTVVRDFMPAQPKAARSTLQVGREL
jgi:hypothetical protein